MPTKGRYKTKYAGVYYIEGKGASGPEKIYYIMYRRNGKLIEEKAGRQYQDDMTPARASGIRTSRIEGAELPNIERREAEQAALNAAKDRWTVSLLWDEYESQAVDTKSRRIDKIRFTLYLENDFGSKEPHEIIQLDVDRIRINLLKKMSPQTVKHIMALLRRIINFGVQKRLCSNIDFKIIIPKVSNNKTEDLTKEQLKNLLKAIDNSDDIQAADMMRLALFTGIRRGEMFKLKWDDVDFQRGFIRLRDTKGGDDQTVPMNESARILLQNHPRSLLQDNPQTESEYVFCMNNGRAFTTDLRRRLNRIRDAAGIPKNFRALHGLRHVYASMLASSGQVDMYTLQKLLTHKSPLMTQRYAHLRDETLKRASTIAGIIIQESIEENKSTIVTDQLPIVGDKK
jgi:integrase